MSQSAKDRILRANVIVVEDFNMMRDRLLNNLDAILRKAGEKPDVPFGGVHIIVVGDLAQLAHIGDQRRQEDTTKEQNE